MKLLDVGNGGGDPGEDTENCGEIDKVVKDVLGTSRDVHKSNGGEGGWQCKGVDRYTTPIGSSKETWGTAPERETIYRTRGNVQVRLEAESAKRRIQALRIPRR